MLKIKVNGGDEKIRAETLVKYEAGKKMHEEGVSLSEIGSKLNICSNRLSKWLKTQGVEIRFKSTGILTSNKRVKFFEEIDTEEKAYWLGFLYADGCVNERKKNGKISSMALELSLAEIDRNHIEKFKECIGYNLDIKNKTTKINNKTFNSCRLGVNDTEMCRDLIKLGCTPRKSLTIKFPTEEQVPKHLQRHFIRGYVDGDGSIGFRIAKRKDKTVRRGYITILGTKEFIEGLIKVTKWKKNTIQKPSKAYQIEWCNSKTIEEYLDYLYKDSKIYLERKYNKYLEIRENCRLG